MQNKIIPVFIPHASCPQKCIFCDQNKTTGVNSYSYDSIRTTIEKCLGTMTQRSAEQREIAFYGGSFTALDTDRQIKLLEIARGYIDAGAVDSIRISTRPDAINADILGRLLDYGVSVIELGVQSMSDKVLRVNKRGHTRDDTINASIMIKSAGFTLGHQLMPGMYGSTMETMLRTIDESIRLAPDIMRVYPCLVIRDTRLEELYNSGEFNPFSLDEAAQICKIIYKKATLAGITIIRMGIHPEKDLVKSGIVAGPFHPAFKHLVISSLFYDACAELIKKHDLSGDVEFSVNPRDVSNIIGMNRDNITRLKNNFQLNSVKINKNAKLVENMVALTDAICYCTKIIK